MTRQLSRLLLALLVVCIGCFGQASAQSVLDLQGRQMPHKTNSWAIDNLAIGKRVELTGIIYSTGSTMDVRLRVRTTQYTWRTTPTVNLDLLLGTATAPSSSYYINLNGDNPFTMQWLANTVSIYRMDSVDNTFTDSWDITPASGLGKITTSGGLNIGPLPAGYYVVCIQGKVIPVPAPAP